MTLQNIRLLKTESEYWLTNAGTVTGWAEALRNDYESYGIEVSLQQESGKGWKLTATGLDRLWIASVDGTKVNSYLETIHNDEEIIQHTCGSYDVLFSIRHARE